MTTSAAQQFAQWLEAQHPDFYEALHAHVANLNQRNVTRRASLRGMGDDGLVDFNFDFSDTGSDFDVGSDIDPSAFDFEPDMQSLPSFDSTAGGMSDPSMSSISFDPNSISMPSIGTGTVDTAAGASGGLLSTIGSGIANAASSVGSWLTSANGLNSVAKLATAYFQVQNTQAQAAVTSQVIAAQASRAALGQSPAPITYVQGPNGQLIPVYQTNQPIQGTIVGGYPQSLVGAIANGQSQYVGLPNGGTGYTLPGNVLSSLGGGFSLSPTTLLLIVAGVVLLATSSGN